MLGAMVASQENAPFLLQWSLAQGAVGGLPVLVPRGWGCDLPK